VKKPNDDTLKAMESGEQPGDKTYTDVSDMLKDLGLEEKDS